MKVMPLQNHISFGRAYNSEELKEYNNVRKQAQHLLGPTGKSIFIVHDTSLPKTDKINTELGHLSSKESKEFFNYMKPYVGCNTVELVHTGQVGYEGLSLGEHQINLDELTTQKFENILEPAELEKSIKSNNPLDKQAILKKAFERFNDIEDGKKLKLNYYRYFIKNSDWLEPKGLFEVLVKEHGTREFDEWTSDVDKNLFNPDFDKASRTARKNQLLKNNAEDINFFKFKQFLAAEHLAMARQNLNKPSSVKLMGDFRKEFSKDEEWAYPKAFKKDHYLGLPENGIRALDYDALTDETSAAAKLFKRKIQLSAKRYDSIKLYDAWTYVTPIITPKGATEILEEHKKPMGSEILDLIEKYIREKDVRGENFDLKNLIYEFDAGEDEFKPFKENSDELIDPLKSRVKSYSSTYMHDREKFGWGSNDAFLKRGWSPDEFVIGVSKPGSQPVRQIANNVEDISMKLKGNRYHKIDSIGPLSGILKLDSEQLNEPAEFVKAKFAETLMAKNNQMLDIDVFGREERSAGILTNFTEAYHKAVQEGFGLNLMDSYEKVFKTKGLDKSHPELYAKIIKFRDILYEKDIPKSAQDVIENTKEKIAKNRFFRSITTTGTVLAFGWMLTYAYLQTKKKPDSTPSPAPQPIQDNKTAPKVSFDNFAKSN